MMKTMMAPQLNGVDTVICWVSRKIMPLRHRPLKMCEYKADDAGNSILDQDVLEYRLRELVKPLSVKAAVAMFTHDNPAPVVSQSYFVLTFLSIGY